MSRPRSHVVLLLVLAGVLVGLAWLPSIGTTQSDAVDPTSTAERTVQSEVTPQVDTTDECNDPEAISEPQIIDRSGCYVLTTDISNSRFVSHETSHGLDIRADDVTIKGQGFTIESASGGRGVLFNGTRSSVVENAEIDGFRGVDSEAGAVDNV
jgi:hypothetical protein